MRTSEYWIERLKLEKHPEGGYFREIYRSKEEIPASCLPERYDGNRAFSTAIYYLLKSREFSAFHRLKTDEIWHFYAGTTLLVYIIDQKGVFEKKLLGNLPENGEQLVLAIEKGNWFAATVADENSYTLMGCTVAPGFDFNDFELGKRGELVDKFPAFQDIITAYSII